MKVYLYDDYKVYIYSLPTKIEDAFIINYTSYMGVEETIVINARDGKWTISSNESMTLLKNNMKADEENLNGNDFFKIKFGDLDYYLSIICFSSPLQYFDYSVPSLEGFTLGKSSSSQIIYDNSSVLASHIRFYKNGGYWYVDDFNNSNAVMFVNNVRTKIKPLTMGDVIFVHGLKIIWMNDFIRINSPNNLVKSSLSAYKQFGEESENKYSPITDSERGIVLYNESQAFFHTPSIKETIVNKTISITNPPAKRSSDEPPAILTLGSTIMMGLSSSITGVISLFSITKGNIMVGIIQGLMCLITLAGSILFPVLLSGYEKRKSKRLEKIRQTKYLEYLENKKKEINDEIAEEIKILYKNNLSVIECENFIANRSSIWTREISDNDFLTFRLGIGKRKASITLNSSISDFDIEGDNLHEEVVRLINTPLILDEVPITISLIENRILPFIVSPSFNRKQFIDYLLLQLMTYHSSVDLKLVIFTDDSNLFYWDHMKYTPYCYSRDRSKHFFATNEDEMKMVSSSLEDIYNTRILTLNNGNEDDKEINDSHDDLYKKFDEYYLIITDCFISTKKLGIIEKVLDEDSNIGFSLITIEPSMKNVPSKCNKFVEIDDIGMITDKDLSNTDIVSFKVEVMDNALIEDYSFVIAN
ncbi:MAG: FHA domain-containing protein, partial [Bacilli bacterium]|nr:FHA domain-containing protein [Bacilli bacterium]